MWGTPVVALDRGGLREVVSPEIGALVSARGDEQQQVAGIAEALGSVATLQRTDVHRCARRDLGVEAMVADYVEFYRELVLGRGERS